MMEFTSTEEKSIQAKGTLWTNVWHVKTWSFPTVLNSSEW